MVSLSFFLLVNVSSIGWTWPPEPLRPYLVGAAVLILFFGLFLLLARRRDLPYTATPSLLTAAERSFFRVLHPAVGGRCAVMVKVRLADILELQEGVGSKRRLAAFSRIRSKHVDFVLCHPRSFVVVGVIELDDRSHEAPERQQRDAFVDAALGVAGIPILRFKVQRSYSVKEVREAVESLFCLEEG